MKLRIVLIALLGLSLAVYLIGYIGFGAVFDAVLTAGWGGFAIILAYALALYLVLGAAWHVLIADAAVIRFAVFVWGRMVRDSASEVLPFSQLGGFVIGARATILHGVKAADALAELGVAAGAKVLVISTDPGVSSVDLRVEGFNERAAELGYVLVSETQYSHN